MTAENLNTSSDTPAPKDPAIRNPDGRFASTDPKKVMGGSDDWNYEDSPLGEIDPATDPLLSKTPGKDLAAFGFKDQADPDDESDAEDDQPQPKGAKVKGPQDSEGAEANAESQDDGDENAQEDGDDLLAAIVAAGTGATEAGAEDVDAESGSGRATEAGTTGGDDAALMATIRKIGKKNPDLAAQVVREMFSDGESGATPAAPEKRQQKAGRDLRKVWEDAVREGKDFDGITEIVRETVSEILEPVTRATKERENHNKFIRTKVQEFEEFKKKFPGWVAHRQRMGAVLAELAKDLGPVQAANIKPERLLFLAAPEFHREAVKVAAAKATMSKKVTQAGRLAPPASRKAGGSLPAPKGSGTDQQSIVDRTVQRLTRENRIRNFI